MHREGGTRSATRTAVAAILTGVLGLQLALGTPAAAAVFGTTPATAATPATSVAHVGPHAAAASSDLRSGDRSGSHPMPCGRSGTCGWGLMHCDAAGSCVAMQVLPAPGPASFVAAVTIPPTLSTPGEPASLVPAVERPPPRA